MRVRASLAGVAMVLVSCGTAFTQAAESAQPNDTAALLKRVEEVEQRLKVLEQELASRQAAVPAATDQATSSYPANGAMVTPAAPAPIVHASPTRFALESADRANTVRLRGLLHVDGRHFEGSGSPATSNTWLVRRVRPMFEGTLANIYDFRFTPDFGGGKTTIFDAYLTARLRPWANVTLGKFKVPVGLERSQSVTDTRFIERAFPSAIAPNRDIGVQFAGEVARGAVNYNVSYTNGVSDGGSSDSSGDIENDGKGDISARLFFKPFLHSGAPALRGFGFGVGGTYVDSTGSAANTLLPSYKTPGQARFFSYRDNTAGNNATFADGRRLRVAPQFYYYLDNFGVMGEYTTVSQDVTRVSGAITRSASLSHSAWHAQLSWLLTGEKESFKGILPHASFEPGAPGLGAWELVARVQELSIDNGAFAGGADSFADPAAAARNAKSAGIGVNWYMNPNMKWSLNYDFTRFDAGAASGDRPDEKAWLMRLGLAF